MSSHAASYARHIETLAQRYTEALAHCGFDFLLIASGEAPLTFLDDNALPFVANPHFKAWLPLTAHPGCWLVIRPGERPRLLYYQPEDFWFLPPADPAGFWVEHFDITVVRRDAEIPGALARQGGRGAFIGEDLPGYRDRGIENANPPGLLDYLHYHRAWKTPYEIECMAAASRLGVRAHRAAEQAFRAGASEYQIHLAYLAACGHTEDELPYHNIIALNEHAAVLHYQHFDREPPDNHDSFLIDAGASYNGYACDITRTHAGGDGLFGDLVTAMDGVQQRICGGLRPGVSFVTQHLDTHLAIAGLLQDFRLVRMTPESQVESGVSGHFFPHGLGHFLGLQVHDAGGFMANAEGERIPKPGGHETLRLTRTLEAGQVTTVEPGLYFIEPLLAQLRRSPHGAAVNWERIDALRPCGGIRIEDNILVTAQGRVNLTREAFAELS